jgi:hypothetical protein
MTELVRMKLIQMSMLIAIIYFYTEYSFGHELQRGNPTFERRPLWIGTAAQEEATRWIFSIPVSSLSIVFEIPSS